MQFQEELDQDTPCQDCANWNLLSAIMWFPAHDDYPTCCKPGCPIEPPIPGRHEFGENIKLPFLPMDWQLMKQACRFAFYQVSDARVKPWTKAEALQYVGSCGVSPTVGAELWKSCHSVSKRQRTRISELPGVHKDWKVSIPSRLAFGKGDSGRPRGGDYAHVVPSEWKNPILNCSTNG